MQHVKGYISFTGMHFVDAYDYHTLIIGECDVETRLIPINMQIRFRHYLKDCYLKYL